MGNLAFTDHHNQLTISNIHKMSTCRLFEKFTATSRQCLGQPLNKAKRPVRKSASKRHVQQQEAPREDQALLLRRHLPLVPNKASSDAGPELAGRESRAVMENPKALIAPLKGGVNKSSSDDRPGPCICDSKYVEDAKAARSVRVWDRVPIKQQG